jgi:hypothetical protein
MEQKISKLDGNGVTYFLILMGRGTINKVQKIEGFYLKCALAYNLLFSVVSLGRLCRESILTMRYRGPCSREPLNKKRRTASAYLEN